MVCAVHSAFYPPPLNEPIGEGMLAYGAGARTSRSHSLVPQISAIDLSWHPPPSSPHPTPPAELFEAIAGWGGEKEAFFVRLRMYSQVHLLKPGTL